jgi:WhiB family redox-sensing transcriptional regulator
LSRLVSGHPLGGTSADDPAKAVEPVAGQLRKVRREEVVVDEETPEELAWMLRARCRGASPTDFFPSDGLGVESAQHICELCPVRAECLEYALVNHIEHGVWGGASERERRRILRRRRDPLPSTRT